jgi:predicted TIM-barrel fold metal-dependent hydrolase
VTGVIVDAHVHVGTWRDPAYAGRSMNLRQTVRALSAGGVSAAFVFPTDARDNEGLLSEIKQHAGEQTGSFPVYYFPWVDIRRHDFRAFLETERDWIYGLKFHPSYDRKPVISEEYTPYFEFARQHGLPVIIHCGRWQEVAGYFFALERARSFPDVPFVLSHLGGDLPQLQRGAVKQVVRRDIHNVRFGTESIREYWNLEFGIKELGASRFLFGSDFSLGHPLIYRAVLTLCDMAEKDRDLILGQNAMRLVHASRK